MYYAGKIILGIVAFVLFATFPFYNNAGKVSAKPEPKLDTPVIQQLAEKKCVELKEFMRAEHMQLLDNWRNSAIREGKRVYINSEGKEFRISLQNTCMNCHSNKKEFCDKCHNYAAVRPYCWTCHIEPKEKQL